jgi:transmembrane sensor
MRSGGHFIRRAFHKQEEDVSGVGERSIVTNAREIDARAAYWIQRREFWEWTETDQIQFDEWLGKSLAHQVAYVRLTLGWNRTERLAALRPSRDEQILSPTRPPRMLAFSATAGLVIAAVLSVGAFLLFSGPTTQTYATAVGGHQTVRLADGSQVELNTNTILSVRIGEHKREISLDRGEAYFKVLHDARRPFVVMAGDRRITDLGTAFSVRRDMGRLEVAVMEGRVRFDASGDGELKPATLSEGDVAVATRNSLSVTKKSSQKLVSELSWRRGLLVFEHATLADAAAEFNRYNREKLVIAGPAAARRTIGATFRINDIRAFARVAQEVFGLRVDVRGDEIVISR